MNTQKTTKSDAIRFVNTVVKAKKMFQKQYESLNNLGILNLDAIYTNFGHRVQMSNLVELANLIGQVVLQREWDGNDTTESKYDEIYFDYKGITFFELVDREEK